MGANSCRSAPDEPLEPAFEKLLNLLLALSIENRRLRRDLEQRANETSVILDAVNALHSSLSLEVTMQRILEAISRVTGVPHSSVYLLDATRAKLLPAFKRTVGIPSQKGIFWKVALDVQRDGFVKDVIQSKQPVVAYDADIDPRCNKDIVAIFHNKSVLGLPLVTRGEVLGVVFNTTFGELHTFAEDQVRLGFALASSAAVAIENARLFEESQFRNEQLAALHHISLAISSQLDLPELLRSVVESAATLLKAKAGAVALVDEAQRKLRFVARYNAPGACETLSLNPDEAFDGTLVIDDAVWLVDSQGGVLRRANRASSSGTASVLAVPLKWKGEVIGVIEVFDKADSRLFDRDDAELLERFAAQAAVAIKNARFVQEAARAEAMRETARLKSEFLSMVSHELRSPVGLIRGYASALNRDDMILTPEQRESFSRRIDEAASLLSEMTRDILDVARIEAGQFPVHRTVFDLEATIGRLIQRIKLDKGDRWQFVTDVTDGLLVEADPSQIERVLDNLLSNAIKYCPDGGQIMVRARVVDERANGVSETTDGEWVVVEVQDDGIGILKQDLSHVFEKFYQGRRRENRMPEGVGLGLYICKQLIQAHGGTIWARNKPGKGCVLSFKIPKGAAK